MLRILVDYKPTLVLQMVNGPRKEVLTLDSAAFHLVGSIEILFSQPFRIPLRRRDIKQVLILMTEKRHIHVMTRMVGFLRLHTFHHFDLALHDFHGLH